MSGSVFLALLFGLPALVRAQDAPADPPHPPRGPNEIVSQSDLAIVRPFVEAVEAFPRRHPDYLGDLDYPLANSRPARNGGEPTYANLRFPEVARLLRGCRAYDPRRDIDRPMTIYFTWDCRQSELGEEWVASTLNISGDRIGSASLMVGMPVVVMVPGGKGN